MTRRDWDRRLPAGVHLVSHGRTGFRLGVTLSTGEDGLWPMRCPRYPQDHLFKMSVTQGTDDGARGTGLYCPYCGHHAEDTWAFAPQQRAVMDAAARAAAEQYVSSKLDDVLAKAFGGRSRSRSSSRGFGINVEYRSGRPPARRTLPSFEVEATRRTMQCERCQDQFAVYGLAIYCPSCGQLAPAQQFAELVRVHQERLAALDALPEDQIRALREGGVLTATYESTIKDGFSALETYLKARFVAEAPTVSLAGMGPVFQRLGDAANLYREHLNVDLRAVVGEDGWIHLLLTADVRHLLVHSSGVIDTRFLDRQPGWPQALGQRLHVRESDAHRLLDVLTSLAAAIRPT